MQESLTFARDRPSQIPAGAEERSRECREQEYKDRFGTCRPCKQCEAGQELSKVGAPHSAPRCLTPVLQVKPEDSNHARGAFMSSRASLGKRKGQVT